MSARERYSSLQRRWRAAVGPVRGRQGVDRPSEAIVDHIDEHFEELYRRVEALEADSDE